MANIPVSYNVSSTDQQRFRQFIDDVRIMLRVEERPIVMQDAARLPPQEDVPHRWLDLELRDGDDNVVTLRIRADNLYLRGFRGGNGEWFELQRDNGGPPLIQGSSPLKFKGSYDGGGIGTIEDQLPTRKNEKPRPNVRLGRPSVRDAIEGLANYHQTRSDDVKEWLRTLVVNFIESIRFNSVADHVAVQMANPSPDRDSDDVRLSFEMMNQIKNWGGISDALLCAANDTVQDPHVLAALFNNFRTAGIHNAFGAAAALGMVLITNHRRRRQRRSVDDDADQSAAGLTLVEVIEVVLKDIDGEDPGDLYGTVAITDGFGSQQVFGRDRYNVQIARPGDHAKLSGPARAISGADDFFIVVDLKDRDSLPDLSPDDDVSSGQVVYWNSREATSDRFDTVHRVADSKNHVEVVYAVMTEAAVATVEVVLLDGDGESVPDVFGTITARTTMEDGTPVTVMLFDRERAKQVGVPKGSRIPIRNIVAVPLCSTIQIEANLWDRDSIPDLSPDDQIAQGSLTFVPRLPGEDSGKITGKQGGVSVRVTWSLSLEGTPLGSDPIEP